MASASPTSNDFSYSGAPLAIPDAADLSGTNPGAPADANLDVSGMTGVVSNVVFTIGGTACSTAAGSPTAGLAHTFVSDLKLTLIAPDGTSVVFMDQVGGSGNNICQAVYDDTAATNIQTVGSAEAPFTGTWKPANSFSALTGVNPNGTWKLRAQDFFSQDSGVIQAFSIALTTAPEFTLAAHTMTVSGSGDQGTAVTYTTIIGNDGLQASSDNPGNEYTNVLPSGVTLTSVSASQGTAVATVGTNTVTWNGSIPAHGTVTITTVATVGANTVGTVSNQGTISYDSDANGTNDSSAVTDDPGTVTANDPTSFTAVDVTPPSVTITPTVTATSGTHIRFTVTFSESVTGFTSDDVVLDGTAGADTAVVTGSGAHYTVTVSGMTGSGTVTALIPAGAAQDASGNLNLVSGATPASVRYIQLPSLAITGVDPAPGAMMALLFLGLGGALLVRRRVAAR